MKRNDILVLAAGLFVGAGIALFVYFGLDLSNRNSGKDGVISGANLPRSAFIGTTAPDFELVDLKGDEIRLSEFQGKIVILNFWATWCEPCKVEMPFFERLHRTELSNVQILGINFDEPPDQVRQFVEEYDLTFPILLDPGGAVQKMYRVRGYPTTLIVDEQGIIDFHHIGLITEDQLNQYLTEMGAVN